MARVLPPLVRRRRIWFGATVIAALAAFLLGAVIGVRPSTAQTRNLVDFPPRPKQPGKTGANLLQPVAPGAGDQMMVRANEVDYDYTNERVSAVGNVQIYFRNSSLEADKVIYDQKTKRLHAQGNIQLREPDGKVTYGEIIDLSDDFRDGFVDSLRLDGPDQTRLAATRAERTSGNITVFQNGVYTACEPCKDEPTKPPKWQVKAARIIHAQDEKMLFFEDMRLEFFGVPLAWLPYFSAPDPTAKRKTGFLMPTITSGSHFGIGFTTPYYWALAPDYDATITPTITTKQGPLLQGEWRQRLINGSYSIRGAGIFQLDKKALLSAGDLPGYRDFRGSIESTGQFRLSDKWVYGWDGTVITDKSFFQDYGLYRRIMSSTMLPSTPDYVLSQAYLSGRGDRSYFDARAMYFYGFASTDNQKQMPVVHPVINSDYTFGSPILGGELNVRSNLTSVTRETAFFDPISANAVQNGLCNITTADPTQKTLNNCLLRGTPGTFTRLSSEATWRRSIIDPFGQVFTPFVSARADYANVQITADPGVSNYMTAGANDVARFMPTVGLLYRYPLINVQSWGTQTIEPIVQILARPNETGIGLIPNEDSQSLIFDASNLLSSNKFSGWDRVEGGGRANAGIQYTAQFNRGGFVNVLVGQSYHLFGQNSFTVGGPTNTGIASGLDNARSDYVARASFQPSSMFTLTSRFRVAESDLTLQRSEVEATTNFDRWSATLLYGNYAPQPALGFLDRREGIVSSAKFKINPNWLLSGAVRYDLRVGQVTETQVGVGYVDDCLIIAMNYITEYAYNSNQRLNHAVMFQLGLRTLGGSTVSSSFSTLNQQIPGYTR